MLAGNQDDCRGFGVVQVYSKEGAGGTGGGGGNYEREEVEGKWELELKFVQSFIERDSDIPLFVSNGLIYRVAFKSDYSDL